MLGAVNVARSSVLRPRQRGVPAVCTALAIPTLQQRDDAISVADSRLKRRTLERTNTGNCENCVRNSPAPFRAISLSETNLWVLTEKHPRHRSFSISLLSLVSVRCSLRRVHSTAKNRPILTLLMDRQHTHQTDLYRNVTLMLPGNNKLNIVEIGRAPPLKVTFFHKMFSLSTGLAFR